MAKIILILMFVINLYSKTQANTEEKQTNTFLGDVVNTLSQSLDENVTDKIKLENLQNYIENLKFDDKVNKSKYKLNVMGHYENYMLLGSYTPDNLVERHWTNGVRDTSKDYDRKKNEAQFQLSIKVPLYNNFLNSGADLFTAYTQNSYWQVYDKVHSAPFRETNYQPELFMEWQPKKRFGESTLNIVRFSLIHQSNGQDVGQSRSWNRSELFFLFQDQNIFYGMNIWDRWSETTKTSAADPQGDDNPDLEKYIGKEKFFVKYKGEHMNLTVFHQNDLLNYSLAKGNTKVDLTFPSVNKNIDFFIRYFHGYGESLIDYDVKINRVSFGIMIADWL